MIMQRRYLWDNLKFFLIFCVVLGHYAGYYMDDIENMRRLFFLLYLFHMPAFVFVSGLFSKKIVNEKRWNKVLDYFIMYVFVKGILVIAARMNGSQKEFWLLRADGVEWYAFAIMVFLVMTMITRRLDPKFVFVFSIFVGCLSGYHSADGDFLVLQRILVFYPFFYLGYLMDPDKIEKFTRKKIYRIFAAVIAIATVAVIYCGIDMIYGWRPMLTGRNPYSILGPQEVYGGIQRCGYYIVVFVLIFALIALMPTAKSIISTWGSHTLSVYVLHRAAIYFFMGIAGGGALIHAHFARHPGIILVPAAMITTIVFSMPCWDKILRPVLHPKWKGSAK